MSPHRLCSFLAIHDPSHKTMMLPARKKTGSSSKASYKTHMQKADRSKSQTAIKVITEMVSNQIKSNQRTDIPFPDMLHLEAFLQLRGYGWGSINTSKLDKESKIHLLNKD